MCKLSIIVPIYNVEQYLPRCIESILSQSFQDFELILVEDGSPDRSGEMIDNYAKLDDRIIAIHQTNKGVSAARNAGLKIAGGEYIGFVDPDDWVENSMYSKMVDLLDDNDGDLVFCNWDIFQDTNGSQECHLMPDFPVSMTGEEFFCHIFDIPRTVGGAVWNKIIRKDIIRCYFNEEYSIGEDWLFLAQICISKIKIIFCPDVLYHFVSHMGSATNKEKGRIAQGIPVRREIIGVARNISKESIELAESSFLDQCVMFIKLKGINPEYKKIAIDELLSYMRENPYCIIKNKKLSAKQKVYFMYCYLLLKCRKGM